MSDSPVRRRGRALFDGRGLARLVGQAGAMALRDRPADTVGARAVARSIRAFVDEKAAQRDPRARVVDAGEAAALPAVEWVLAVEAIDGVDAYVAGLPTWAIAVGLLRHGKPWSAAVFAPALDDLYVASSGTLRWRGEAVPPGGVRPLATGFVLGTGVEKRSILRLGRRREAQSPVFYHACLVARGAAEGAILGPLNQREVALIRSLLGPVGGAMHSLRTGAPLDMEALRNGRPTKQPILIARAGRADALLARLKR